MKQITVNNLEEAVSAITSEVTKGKEVRNMTASVYNRQHFQIIDNLLYIWNEYMVGEKPRGGKLYQEGVSIYNTTSRIKESIKDFFDKYLYDEDYGGGDHEGDWGYQFKEPVILESN
jgi:hypothetical protein